MNDNKGTVFYTLPKGSGWISIDKVLIYCNLLFVTKCCIWPLDKEDIQQIWNKSCEFYSVL